MTKEERKQLIIKLASKKTVKKPTQHKKDKPKSSRVDFVAFTEPTETDVMDELSRMGSFNRKK